jgi:hypothetical protein
MASRLIVAEAHSIFGAMPHELLPGHRYPLPESIPERPTEAPTKLPGEI